MPCTKFLSLPGEYMAAGNETTFTLKLKTEGMDQAEQKSQRIRENLESAQKAGAPGTTTSRRMASSAAAQPTGAAGVSAGVSSRDVEEYNRARGTAGAAGGSARDFADQARGLGGLVRLYATVAANAFAAAAAFTALSNAMDTTNMVKGLDQLGAASGTALGSLSKRLVQSTEGAVSLREAMEATVKASSAGLNTDQILKLGDISKKAAQALGLNMTDALSRLTRGITKLEPELLDELGIFVKIDDAVNKYALSVGKSASAITDFERRMAFANAVLDQGNKKFGEINIDTNPYTKLAATIQNLAQTFLEFVNKGLAPLAGFLSENTKLLAVLGTIIAVKLVKAALPALSQWQEGLVRSAAIAKKTASDISTSYGEAFVDRLNAKLNLPQLEDSFNRTKTAAAKLATEAGFDKLAARIKNLSAEQKLNAGQITKEINDRQKQIVALQQVNDTASKKQIANIQKEIALYEALKAEIAELKAVAGKVTGAREILGEEAEKPATLGERARGRVSKEAGRTALTYEAVSAVSRDTAEKGFREAMSRLNKQLTVDGVGYIRKFAGMAVGTFAAVTTTIGIFANAVQGYLAVFTVILGLGAALISILSNTKKESQLTGEAFDRLNGAAKTTRETLEKISMIKDPLERISVESLQAKANALKELGDSAVLAQRRAFDELAKMNFGDWLVNAVKGIVNLDIKSVLADSLTDSVTQAFRLLEEGPAKEEANKALESIIGVRADSARLGSTISSAVQAGDAKTLAELTKLIQILGDKTSISAAKGTEFKDSIKKISTNIQEFNKSLQLTDPLSKFGADATEAAKKLTIALDDPTQSLNAMRNAVNSVDFLAAFPQETAQRLMGYKSELDKLAISLEKVSTVSPETVEEIKKLDRQLEFNKQELVKRQRDVKINIKAGQTVEDAEKANQTIQSLESSIREAQKRLDTLRNTPLRLRAEIETKIDSIKAEFDKGVRESLIKSANIMAAQFSAELAKAQTTVVSTIAGYLGDTEVGIKLRSDIERQTINANMQVAKESFSLATKVEQLKIEIEKKRLQEEKSNTDRNDKARLAVINKRLDELDAISNIYSGMDKRTATQILKEGGTPEQAEAANRGRAQQVQMAGGRAQLQAVDIKEEIDLLAVRQKLEGQILDAKIKQTANTTRMLELQKETGAITLEQYARESNTLAQKKIEEDSEKRKKEYMDEYSKSLALAAKLDEQKKNVQANELRNLAESRKKQAEELADSDKLVALQDQQARNGKILVDIEREKQEKAQKEIEFRETLTRSQEELARIAVNSKQEEFAAIVRNNEVSEEYAAKRIAEIAQENQAITYQSQLRAETATRDAAVRAALNKAAQEQARTGDSEAGMVTANEEIARANQLYTQRTAVIDASNASATRAIELTKQQSLETAKQNEELRKQAEILGLFEGIADILSSSFGKAGGAIGAFISSLGQAYKTQSDFNIERKKYDDILAEGAAIEQAGREMTTEEAEKEKKARADLAKLERKNTKDSISDTARMLGATKGFFKEKTGAYKALNALEKATHLISMAMQAQQMAANLQNIGTTIAGIAPKVANGVAELFKQGGWAGFVGAAAFLALMASLGHGGSGKAPPPKGFTAEEQQKVQGTGSFYRNGELMDSGAGVLGAPEAKSESVVKGIENLEKYSFNNLEYSNKMLDALVSIRENTRAFAATVIKSIPGITKEVETITSGNWLTGKDTIEVVDKGIKVIGNIGQIIDKTAGIFEYRNLLETTRGLFGFGKDEFGSVQNIPVPTDDFSRLLSNIFSSMEKGLSAAAETLGVGATKDISEAFRALDISDQLKTSLLGAEDGEEVAETLLQVISSGMDVATKALFPWVKEFQQVGEAFGDTILRLANNTRTVTLSFEEMGFALPRLAETGSRATVSQLQRLTDAQRAYDAALLETQKVNEVIRTTSDENQSQYVEYVTGSVAASEALARAQQALTLATQEVEIANNSLTTNNIKLVEGLIEAAGGLDKFVEKNKFFTENFLSDAERLAPIQARVNSELERLAPVLQKAGFTGIKTREDFKKVVLSLDDVNNAVNITTKDGQDLYTALMNLAPAFVEVTQGAESTRKALSEMDMFFKVLDQQVTMLGLLGRAEDALLIKRGRELYELSKYPKEQADVLIANQMYIYSLEDEKALKDKLIKQRDKEKQALNSTITSLKTSITTLENFKNSLLGGDKSILTPAQRYQEAQREFQKVRATALSTPTTEAERAAQAEAIGKLPGLADKFLETSRVLFASGEQYTRDFKEVVGVVDTATGKLIDQKTDAELQLDQLEKSTKILDTIDDNTATTATLLQQYLTLQQTNSTAFTSVLGSITTNLGIGRNYISGINNPLVGQGVEDLIAGTATLATSAATTAASIAATTVATTAATTATTAATTAITTGVATAANTTGTVAASNIGYATMENTLADIETVLRNQADYTQYFVDLRLQTGEIKETLNTHFATEPPYLPIVTEIKQTNIKLDELNAQVQELRGEQKVQTGDIITSNARVNQNVADEIAEAISSASTTVKWAERQLIGTPYEMSMK